MSSRLVRSLSALCAPFATTVGFAFLLTYIFVLYQPSFGPGGVQRVGWQAWDVVIDNTTHDRPVSRPDDTVDTTSFPLDVWAPLLSHDTGFSEITVTHCLAPPHIFSDLCAPSSTVEEDAIKGKWVRVPRDLNLELGYASGYLEMYYRRTRRQDVNLVTDLQLLLAEDEPSPRDNWVKVKTSLRAGVMKAPPLYLWYRLGKTAGAMTKKERALLVTELDVLYGDDVPWYGFERLRPPTLAKRDPIEATWITYRKGVKMPPRAPPLRFSHSGKFKIMQIADLHFSVSQGTCKDTPKPCHDSDNITSSLLMHVLDEEKPNLVVFTGDQLNGQGTSWDPKSVLAKFARAATDLGIPWAAVFGNHDSEVGATRERQLEMMKYLPYSLVERGPKDIHGVGNYLLKVMSADASETHLLTLYFLDSGAYSGGLLSWLGLSALEYDWIHQDQTNWFLQQSASISPIERPFHPDTDERIWSRQSDQLTPDTKKLAKPNALMFFHIPLPETYNNADLDPQTGRPLDVGIHNLERPGNSRHNDGFFEKGLLQAKESDRRNRALIPEVKVVGNGHCHVTENCRRVQGVWMCFGGGGSYSGYGKIGFDRRFRIYEISEYGETIRTYKRTEKDEIVDSMELAGRGAASHRMSQSHRRDNPSVSSTMSSSRSDRSARANSHPAVESAVTRLLVSIKQLLESLTQWSQSKCDEIQVSDVYVRLGNDFNAAVTSFAAYNIDMSELVSVPDDLRNILEPCLAEEASTESLEIYLPSVRQIITNLLQGLRGKQAIYRSIVSEHKHRSNGEVKQERSEARSSRSDRDRDRASRRNDAAHRSRASSRPDTDRAASRELAREGPSRRSTAQSTSSVSSRRGEEEEQSFVGGFAPTITNRQPALPEYQEYSTVQEASSRKQRPIPPLPAENATPPAQVPIPLLNDIQPPETATPSNANTHNTDKLLPSIPVVPAHIKRFSLVDKPMSPSPPPVLVEPSSPDDYRESSSTPPPAIPVDPPPAVANSLAALKNTDVLERRASKRFSTFNISKMTGSSNREKSARNHPNRRSLAASSALTPGELAVLTEVDDEDQSDETSTLRREGSQRSRHSVSRTVTPDRRQPVPPLPTTPARTPEPVVKTEVNGVQIEPINGQAEPRQELSKISVFLQLGREVKKVKVEKGLSSSSLRVLFVDKFSYNPGLENFPAIYIRDPSSGVQYELEDTDEVKEKCLLSLNIEPLDQIKQHIDSQISNLSQDIKELKSAVNTRQPFPIVAQPLAESTPPPNRPSDRQFQTIARRLSKFISSTSAQDGLPEPSVHQVPTHMTGQSLQSQLTGASVMSEHSTRIVSDLKTQFDEVQNLRRDLAIMRQLYTEFMKQTQDSLGTLRTQTQTVRQLATTIVGGARAYIDSGKKKLDSRSQNLLTEVEKLQDAVENVKDDVIKRQVTPKAPFLKAVKKDMESVAAELESLREHIKTIKPMWKKTWEEELQNIVEEQQFLTHQEEFLNDMLEDHKAVAEIYGHIEKVISLRNNGPNGSSRSSRSRNFRPPPPDEGHGGLSTVMMELRGAASMDPERRLKAIEANQKNRQKELASRTDELHSELTEFVGQKRLRMTGGAEEIERVRQKKNDMTLKAMLTGSSTNGASTSSSFGSDLSNTSSTSSQPHHH
ncbi:hypothetical protein APHAL10511_004423 [Amanita phalloides]|nr:hypothetical protein APHAL10511_004423 [Amanita phalloides]